MAKGIEGEIDGAIGKGTEKGGNRFLGAVGKWTKRAGLLGAAVTAGFVVKGGISRLMAMDEAEAKLRGLRYNADEIGSIMDNARAAVTGTAFGLGDAATAAASALASGIKPGKELERYLRLVGDAATQGGASFTEMGSILNKTTARGKVGMENLNQLTERGIGIQAWLADHYKVSGEELSKMVSRGEVDSETFRKVLEKNIGGAALESGNTMRGSLANLGASLGRIGASVIKPLFDSVKVGAQNLTKWLAPVEKIASRFGDRLAKAFEGFDLGALFGGGSGDEASRLFERLGESLRRIFDALAPLMPVLRDFAVQLWERMVPAVRSLWGAIADNLLPALAALVEALAPVVTWLMQAFGERVIAAMTGAKDVMVGVVNVISGLVGLVAALFKGDWAAAWESFKLILSGAWDAVKGILASAWAMVQASFSRGINAAKRIAKSGFDGIVNMIKGIPGRLIALGGEFLNAGKKIASKLFDGVSGAVEKVGDIGKNFANGIIDAINWGIQKINNSLPNSIPMPGPIPDIDLPDNPFPKIPKLAKGGIVDRPTLALIGEAGPEAVVPLDRYDAQRGEGWMGEIVDFMRRELPGLLREATREGSFAGVERGIEERGRRDVADSRRGLVVGGI